MTPEHAPKHTAKRTKLAKLAAALAAALMFTATPVVASEDGVGEATSLSEDTTTLESSSAGQQTEPFSEPATINREDGDIESITITAGCESGEEATVAEGAEITLSGADGEELTFTDGEGNADIASDGSTVTIAPTNADEDFVPGGDDTLEGETATVVEQTGITCGAVDADGDGNTTSAPESAGSASCENGRSLVDITAFSQAVDDEETIRTDEFTTAGDSFRVRFDVTSTGTDEDEAALRVSVLDGDGERVDDGFEADLDESNVTDSGVFVADLAAGTYRFEVVAENVQFDLTVAECRADPANAPEASDPRDEVITNTIPDKSLANTGGPNLGVMAAGVLFVVVGASLVRFIARRRRGV